MQDLTALPARIATRIAVNGETGCWEWTGSKQGGYGSVTYGGRSHGVHRLVYRLLVGEIPDGLVCDHLCRVRNCCNPEHIEIVTQKENKIRGVGWAGQHARKTHCIHGHPFDEQNTYRWAGDPDRRYCRTCVDRNRAEWRARVKEVPRG